MKSPITIPDVGKTEALCSAGIQTLGVGDSLPNGEPLVTDAVVIRVRPSFWCPAN